MATRDFVTITECGYDNIEASDTIGATTWTAKSVYTMNDPDEALSMKMLHVKGYSTTKIARTLECSHHTELRYVRNGFDTYPRKQPPSAVDTNTEFLLERFLRHNGEAEEASQELSQGLEIQVSIAMLSCAFGATGIEGRDQPVRQFVP